MRTNAFCLGILAASLLPAAAQLTVEVVQEQDQFLPGESLPVAVRITNRSGRMLTLGDADDWLTFSIQTLEGRLVSKNGDAPVAGKFTLESSQIGTKRLDLAPYFSLAEPGRYEITASLHIRNWEREITSHPKAFDIVEGAKLWEQEFGVPPARGASNGTPEMRKYVLQQVNYLRGQLRLYLRLLDSSGRPLRVSPIGQVLSFSAPEPQVDSASNLHVLYQGGPHSFRYLVYNPDGELVLRRTYDYLDSRPRLNVNPQGQTVVIGGLRHVTATDFPAPISPTAPSEEQPKSSTTPAAPSGPTPPQEHGLSSQP